jgi:hypothetical protein
MQHLRHPSQIQGRRRIVGGQLRNIDADITGEYFATIPIFSKENSNCGWTGAAPIFSVEVNEWPLE